MEMKKKNVTLDSFDSFIRTLKDPSQQEWKTFTINVILSVK